MFRIRQAEIDKIEGKDSISMVAKYWKKVCFVILIIACLFNIVHKLVQKPSLLNEIRSSVQYVDSTKNQKGK